MSGKSYRRHRSNQKKRGGGGSGGIWGLRAKFGTRATRVHFARPEKPYPDKETGEKEDYLLVTEHFVRGANQGKGAGLRCGDQCVTCALSSPQEFDLDIEPNDKLAKCYPRDQFVVSGWIEEPHHIVEEKSKRDPSKTFEVRKRCQGQKCTHCRSDVPVVFGSRFYYGFSSNAWTNSLMEAHIGAGEICKCGGRCYSIEYKCSNPKCDTVLYDAAEECNKCGSDNISIEVIGEEDEDEVVVCVCKGCKKQWSLSILDNEDLAEEVMEEVRCPECEEVDIPEPFVECTEDGCDGEPYDIFDCQLKIKKESAEQTAPLVIVRWRIKDPDPRLFDPEHQGDDGEKQAEIMKTPLDLTDAYKPQSTSEQAKLLGVRDPFAQASGSGVRQYEDTEDDD